MRNSILVLVLMLAPCVAAAQQNSPQTPPAQEPPADTNPPPPAPPPLVEAPKSDTPTAQPAPQTQPPSQGYVPQGQTQVPYPYSPVQQRTPQEPGPEIGLMFTESAFGILTSAGSGLLVYLLLIRPLMSPGIGSTMALPPPIPDIIFILTFGTVPLAVAQTEVNLANGSRYYYSESWPASLSGLGTQALIIGLFYLLRNVDAAAAEVFLLSATVLAVPLVEMAVINLTKTPKWKLPGGGLGSLLKYREGRGLQVGIPAPVPVLVRDTKGVSLGAGVSLLSGAF